MKRLLGTTLLVVAVASFATVATGAESEKPVELRIDVPAVGSDNPDVRAASRKEVAERANDRIRKRLRAADIKFVNVHTLEDGGTIVVQVDADHSREIVAGIILPAGELAVRPLLEVGGRWTELSSEMPQGVELRAGENPMERESAYVWSEDRPKLERFLQGVSVSEGKVEVYPDRGGWRTVTLGESVVTDADVEGSEIRRVSTGSPFVRVRLERRIQAGPGERNRRMAALLDGEVVSVMNTTALTGETLSIPAPSHLSGWEASINWARQVAGRLATTMPVQLVPLE